MCLPEQTSAPAPRRSVRANNAVTFPRCSLGTTQDREHLYRNSTGTGAGLVLRARQCGLHANPADFKRTRDEALGRGHPLGPLDLDSPEWAGRVGARFVYRKLGWKRAEQSRRAGATGVGSDRCSTSG